MSCDILPDARKVTLATNETVQCFLISCPIHRWCTLGYQYDWTNRSYTEKARNPFPEAVSELYDKALREVKLERSHKAEAAIVNFYTPKSTLGGHLDDVEPDQEAPIVSVSLGCTAVFLIGTDC